jgi:mono/diheme cytochrome c family protein
MKPAWLMTSGLVFFCMILTVAAHGTQSMTRAEAAKLKNPVAATADSIAAGKALYGKYCRFCHGATGNGQSPSAPKDVKPADLTDAKWDRGSTDGEIFLVIQEGAGPLFQMKGLKGKLSEEDTWHLVNFTRTLASDAKQ